MSNGSGLGVGVIGCGHVTQRHHLPVLRALEATVPGLRIAALADVDETRLDQVADAFGVTARYTSYAQLLANPEVSVVAVLVPPEFHVPVAMDALRANKHVFIEKPLANALDGTSELVALSRSRQVKSTIGFMLRSHRLVEQVKLLVDSGALGTVEMIRTVWTGGPAHRLTLPPWLDQRRAGGGVLIESGVHHYDMWRYLLGDEVAEVSATSRNQPTEDAVASVSARMRSGVLATSVFSKGTSDNHEIEIYGDRARLRMSAYRVDGLEVFRLHDLTGGLKSRLKSVLKFARQFPSSYAISRRGGVFTEAYTREWRSFLEAVRSGGEPVVSLEDGRRALAVGVAAAQSAATHKPVCLDERYAMVSERSTPAVTSPALTG